MIKLTKSPFGIFFTAGSTDACARKGLNLDKYIDALSRTCLTEREDGASMDLCINLLKKEIIVDNWTLPLGLGSWANQVKNDLQEQNFADALSTAVSRLIPTFAATIVRPLAVCAP